MIIDEKISLVRYNVDSEPHIRVKTEVCRACDQPLCLTACPARCYRLENDSVEFFYEGCLECGTCRIICKLGAVDWDYPRGGFGVCYRFV